MVKPLARTDLGVVWTPEISPHTREASRDMAENESGEGYSSPLTGCSAIMRNVPGAGVGWERGLDRKATR